MRNTVSDFLRELKLKDLKKGGLVSLFTRAFQVERQNLLGYERSIAYVQDAYIIQGRHFLVVFMTPATSDGDKVVDPDTRKLIPNPDNGYYRLYLLILDFVPVINEMGLGEGTKKKIGKTHIQKVLDVCDVKLWSNDPSFQYQGMNYYLTRLGGSYRPEKRKPKRWDKINGGAISKHLAGLVNDIKYFYGQMAYYANMLLLKQ